jgi:hypothetical protein
LHNERERVRARCLTGKCYPVGEIFEGVVASH